MRHPPAPPPPPARTWTGLAIGCILDKAHFRGDVLPICLASDTLRVLEGSCLSMAMREVTLLITQVC